MELKKFLKSIKQKLNQKLRGFFKEKVDSKDLRYLEKIVLLIILLVFTLIALDFNKSLSYKKYDRIEFKSAGIFKAKSIHLLVFKDGYRIRISIFTNASCYNDNLRDILYSLEFN